MVSNNSSESVSDSDDSPVQNRNAWASSSQLEERSSSFDEFVNSEVAVARAMVDERYMDNLNDAQKKRVERLKAYQKVSNNQIAASEPLQNESSNESIGDSLPSNSSNASQVTAEETPGHKTNDISENAVQSVEKTKSSIPVRAIKKPLSNLHKRGIKPDVMKKVENKTTKVDPIMQDIITQVPNRISKQKLSKPISNQKKHWMMEEQHIVQKQQPKEHRHLEQLDPIDQANGDTCTEPVKSIEVLVKISGEDKVACANDTNMQKEEGDITSDSEHINVSSSNSSEKGAAQAMASKGTQRGARVHTQEKHIL